MLQKHLIIFKKIEGDNLEKGMRSPLIVRNIFEVIFSQFVFALGVKLKIDAAQHVHFQLLN